MVQVLNGSTTEASWSGQQQRNMAMRGRALLERQKSSGLLLLSLRDSSL